MDLTTVSGEVNDSTTIGIGDLNYVENNTPVMKSAGIVLIILCSVGVVLNIVTAYVLSRSKTIRKITPYPLLLNQCALDCACCLVAINDTLLGNFIKPYNFNTKWHSLYCHALHSRVVFATLNCSSSYNLCIMSVERTVSVMWPLMHRIQVTSYRIKVVAFALWPAGLLLMSSFSIPANGITSSGICHFWSNLSPTHGRVHGVTFNMSYFMIPGSIMLLAYALLLKKLYKRQSVGNTEPAGKVNYTVIRTLATCVVLYLVCHSPRTVISVMARFVGTQIFSSMWYTTSIAMSLCNNLVNPCVYAIQYSDYKKELRKQIRRLFRIKKSKVGKSETDTSGKDNSESNTKSSNIMNSNNEP